MCDRGGGGRAGQRWTARTRRGRRGGRGSRSSIGALIHLLSLAASAEVGEEHQGGPLLLDLTEEVALRAGDESYGLRRHLDDSEVLVLEVLVDGDWTDTLCHDALDVPGKMGERASEREGERPSE